MKNKNKIIFGLALFIVLNILMIYIEKKYIPYENGKARFIIFFFGIIFICSHLFINVNKMYDVIYKKRYLIGTIIFSVLVLFKFNGSSISLWNNNVQPSFPIKSSIIFGKARTIRSDEWLVSTPINLTQASDSVKFSSNNTILSARNNLVTLYPNLPSFDISIISAPNYLGYLVLDTERAFSFSWYLPYFILFFATFEMFMILTNNKRLYSFVGATMILFSPVIQWWQSANIPAYGALAVTLFYYLINCKKFKKKLIISLLFGYSGYLYIMCLYPAWQVPYGYIYLILLIWIYINNKEKVKLKDFGYLIPIFLVIILPIYIIFKQNYDVLTIVNSTVYPGARFSTGGGEWRMLFTYILDIFYPYKNGFNNPCEFSQYLSLFPLPIFYSIYLMIKNKKKDIFLIMTNILLIVFSAWVIFPFPGIISRLLLIYMSTETRIQVAIGYLSIIEIIYIVSHFEDKKLGKKIQIPKNLIMLIGSIIYMFITVKISNNVVNAHFPNYVNIYTSIICLVLFTLIAFLFLKNNKKSNYILSIILIIISIVSGIFVSPINKGLSILYDKPIAKEIRNLVKTNSNSKFLTTDSGFVLPNYLAVNGAKTINSTNQVPNLELYYKLDPELRYDHIYNRYHHLIVNIVDDDTNFILNQSDLITLNVNQKDLCTMNVDYLVTTSQDSNKYSIYKNIYDEYGIKIYEAGCNEEKS